MILYKFRKENMFFIFKRVYISIKKKKIKGEKIVINRVYNVMKNKKKKSNLFIEHNVRYYKLSII